MFNKTTQLHNTRDRISQARTLVSFALDVIRAQEHIKGVSYAPDLLPVADWLLAEADARFLYKAELSLESESEVN